MAIITDNFRKTSAQHLINDINALTGGNSYFIGIGKSDLWQDSAGNLEGSISYNDAVTPAQPLAHNMTNAEVLENLSSISRVTSGNTKRLIPRVLMVAGSKYKTYDPSDTSCFLAEGVAGGFNPCYALFGSNIFICLSNANGVVLGSFAGSDLVTSSNTPFLMGGYVWAFIGTVNPGSGFHTSKYVALDSGSNITSVTGGLLFGFKVITPGSGYSGSSVVVVTGRKINGSSFTLKNTDVGSGITFITGAGGAITAVTLDLSKLIALTNKDIAFATVRIIGGAGAVVNAKLAPANGFGTNNLELLPSYYVGVRASFEGKMGGDGQVGSSLKPYTFRQISLIKNPILSPDLTDSPISDSTADCLRYLTISLPAGLTAQVGDIVFESTGGITTAAGALNAGQAVAYVDHFEGNKLFYHQNNNSSNPGLRVNSAEFSAAAGSIRVNGSADFAYTRSTLPAEYDAYTSLGQNGEVIFVDDRDPIGRANEQTEEIRLVIQY